jgi:hypothetical protein
MNALVDPSLTESINPRISFLTNHRGREDHESWIICAHLLRTFEPQCVRSPALLSGHNVRHSLTATANARDADGRSLEFGDVLVFGLNSGYDRPGGHHHVGELGALGLVDIGNRDQFNGVLT